MNLEFTQNVAAIEARAFLFISGAFKSTIPRKLIPVRKVGKLPPVEPDDIYQFAYEKEYGVDNLQFRKSDVKYVDCITIFDDVLATGGTALALAKALQSMGIVIDKFVFAIELADLKGREKLEEIAPVVSLATF